MKRVVLSAVGAWLTLGSAQESFAFTHHDDAIRTNDGRAIKLAHRVVRPEMGMSRKQGLFDSMFGGNGRAQVDRRSGAIRLLSGYAFASVAELDGVLDEASYEAAARQFVAENAKVFGLNDADLVLDKSATLINKSEQFLKFRVSREGIKIQDAVIDFRFKFGKLVQINNQSFAEAKTDTRARAFNIDNALVSQLGAKGYQHIESMYRVVETKTGYELVRVEMFRTLVGNDVHMTQLESASGDVFEVAPTKHYVGGTASAAVHPRLWKDALVEQAVRDVTVKHSGGTAKSDENGNFDIGVNTSPSLDGISGSRVRINPMTGTAVKSAGSQAGGAWAIKVLKEGAAQSHEDAQIAQTNIYYHTNLIINHAKKYIAADWMERPLTANANLADHCNAHWDGSTINMYTAGPYSNLVCANTGLIADVIYHEWGHGLDHNTGGIEDDAYSEGFGDIVSLMITRNNLLAPDFTLSGMVVRDLDPDKIYPRDQGEMHDEGLIIGSTMWDLFNALTTQYGADRAIDMIANYNFKAIKTASKYTDVYQAVLVIDDNDANLTNGTPNLCLINEVFNAHGLAERTDACLLGKFTDILIDDRLGNGNSVVEPGETVDVDFQLFNGTPETLTGLVGSVNLTSPVAGVTLGDSSVGWAPLEPEQTGASSDGFSMTVDSNVACGTKIPLTVKLEGNGRTAFQKADMLVGRLLGTEESFAGTGLPAPIRDKATTEVPASIAGQQWATGAKVQSARLKMKIAHTYVGDLTVSLKTPSGKLIPIVQGAGSGDELSFDGDISASVAEEVGQGTWNLVVQDKYEVDTGNVTEFSLVMTPALYRCEL